MGIFGGDVGFSFVLYHIPQVLARGVCAKAADSSQSAAKNGGSLLYRTDAKKSADIHRTGFMGGSGASDIYTILSLTLSRRHVQTIWFYKNIF